MKNKTFYIVLLTIVLLLLVYDINCITAQTKGTQSEQGKAVKKFIKAQGA